ncbi:hypothetical protein I4U23_027628 [Adineta vaga]|nr:hypothetical protein I4U23_027628 [Adineta vaga]
MLWILCIFYLFSLNNCILLNQIQNTIIIGNINQFFVNQTRDQCICHMIEFNESISALNYFSVNQTCQLFSSNNNSIKIQLHLDSLLILINQSLQTNYLYVDATSTTIPEATTTETIRFLSLLLQNDDNINMANTYSCNIPSVNITTINNATVYDLCSNDYLSVDACNNSDIFMKQSLCANTITVHSHNMAHINNVCAIVAASMEAEEQSLVTMDSSLVCPQRTVAIGEDYSQILDICAITEMNITGKDSSLITMNSTCVCPKTTNIETTNQTQVLNISANQIMNIISTQLSKVSVDSSICCAQKTIVHAFDSVQLLGLCATEEMNINGEQSAVITMNSTHICPNQTVINATNDAMMSNICAKNLLSIFATQQSAVNVNSEWVCPQNTMAVGSGHSNISNICAIDQMFIRTTDSAAITMNDTAPCPKILHIQYESSIPITNICHSQVLILTITGNSTVNFNASIKCTTTTVLVASGTTEINDLCTDSILNVTGNDLSTINFDSSSRCPNNTAVFGSNETQILNVGAYSTLTIQVRDAANVTLIETCSCPQNTYIISSSTVPISRICAQNTLQMIANVTVIASETTLISNLCATTRLTVQVANTANVLINPKWPLALYSTTLSQILSNITLSIDLITFIFGIIGCIGNLITFTNRQIRQSSAVFYLLCATISELITILICVLFRLFYDRSGSNLLNESSLFCKFRYYFALTLPTICSYYIFLSILDRYFCISHNAKVRARSQIKIAKRISTLMLILSITIPIHILIFYNIYNNLCQIQPSKNRTSNRRKTFEIKLLKIILIQVFLSILLSLLRFGSFTYRNIVFNIITPTVAHRAAVVFAETLGGSLYFVNYALSFFVSIISIQRNVQSH